jgi:hypothetical protein
MGAAFGSQHDAAPATSLNLLWSHRWQKPLSASFFWFVIAVPLFKIENIALSLRAREVLQPFSQNMLKSNKRIHMSHRRFDLLSRPHRPE